MRSFTVEQLGLELVGLELSPNGVAAALAQVPIPNIGPEPTVAQLRLLAADLRCALPLSVTSRRPQFAKFGTHGLVDVVERLGRFLAQSRKSRFTGTIVGGVGPTATAEQVDALVAALASHDARRRIPAQARAAQWFVSDETTAVVPAGWGPTSVRRDIAQALAAIVSDDVTDAELTRFVDRTYRRPVPDLTADHVYLVAWADQHGLLNRLTELGAHHFQAAHVLSAALAVVNTAVADATVAYAQLVESHDDPDPAEVLSAAMSTAWWLGSDSARLSAAAQAALARPSERLSAVVRTRLRTWLSAATCDPMPTRPGQFRTGQLIGACAAAGLDTETENAHEGAQAPADPPGPGRPRKRPGHAPRFVQPPPPVDSAGALW